MHVLCGSELAPTGAVLAWSLALRRRRQQESGDHRQVIGDA